MYKCGLCRYYDFLGYIERDYGYIVNRCIGIPILLDNGGECLSFVEKEKDD